jgi:glutaminyl-peptide cyclotransferase
VSSPTPSGSRRRLVVSVAAIASFVGLLALPGRYSPLTSAAPADAPPARERRVRVLASYPHDPGAFTQGLVYDRGVLYESTGLAGKSTLRRVDLETGRVVDSVPLAPALFGEGLARVPGQLIQLTWTNRVALLYDEQTLRLQRSLPYEGEGWGLCYDGASLVMSDGTSRLAFRRPDTFAVERFVDVTLNGRRVGQLNELECVDGTVYANVWHRDTILRIDPANGRVLERIDASGLLSPRERAAADVLNGIAYDAGDGAFYLAGKLWPRLFKVRFE